MLIIKTKTLAQKRRKLLYRLLCSWRPK